MIHDALNPYSLLESSSRSGCLSLARNKATRGRVRHNKLLPGMIEYSNVFVVIGTGSFLLLRVLNTYLLSRLCDALLAMLAPCCTRNSERKLVCLTAFMNGGGEWPERQTHYVLVCSLQ